jgi:hypothetical protein
MRGMEAGVRSSGSPDMISLGDVLFVLALVFFLAVVCVWPVLAWRIHHFSTYLPTVTHTYPVRDRLGTTIYLGPIFGRFYASLPWIWCTAFAATVAASLLARKKPS